jgi:PAS domain S-box-containing protein
MGILFYNLDDEGTLIFQGCNPAAEIILGLDLNGQIGRTIIEVFPSLADTDLPARYYDAATKGITYQSEEMNYKDEMISGCYEFFAFQTIPGAMAVMFSDITERIQSREDMKKQKELIESVMATSPVAIIVVDTNGDVIYSNPTSEKVFGLNANELSNFGLEQRDKTFLTFEGNLEGRGELPFQTVRKTLQPITNAQYAFRQSDGNLSYLSVNCAPLTDNYGFKGAVFAIEDITSRILAEEEKHKARGTARQFPEARVHRPACRRSRSRLQ